jgi:hypothetical protein
VWGAGHGKKIAQRRARHHVARELRHVSFVFNWTIQNQKERTMRGILLWLIGIPIPIIILLWLFGVLH